MKRDLSQFKDQLFDVFIIGSGINGAISSLALGSGGAKVGLVDKSDFSGFTSGSSSNLVWGGIKYLENLEFGLVFGLCKSRNKLLRYYPENIRETRFMLTPGKGLLRNKWTLYLGTWVYWFMGLFFTKPPKWWSGKKAAKLEPNLPAKAGARIEYSDASLLEGDSRFVFQLLQEAERKGVRLANYLEVTSYQKTGQDWLIKLHDHITGKELSCRSKVLINAAGPYADKIIAQSESKFKHQHILSKGIHLIVKRLQQTDRVLAFFSDDDRFFFVLPFGTGTSIGTTDTPVEKPETEPDDKDIDFVLDNINQRLNLSKPLTRDDVISYRCGVRPLAVLRGKGSGKNWINLSRKHIIEQSPDDKTFITIFGGKLTDCLNIGDEIFNLAEKQGIGLKKNSWFGEHNQNKLQFLEKASKLGWTKALENKEPQAERLWRRYGEAAFQIYDIASQDNLMNQPILEEGGVLMAEAKWAAENEMVQTLEDWLHRRTLIGALNKKSELINNEQLKDACEILFGPKAGDEWSHYFGL